jgi:hypothetical protein
MDPLIGDPGESRRGSICRCVAYQPDGQMCGRRAVVMDMHRGGMVCAEHAPAALAPLAKAVRRLSDAWPTLPENFRKLVVHVLEHIPGGGDCDTQADHLNSWADLTLLADLLLTLERDTDVVATQWVVRTAEQRRVGQS